LTKGSRFWGTLTAADVHAEPGGKEKEWRERKRLVSKRTSGGREKQ